MFNFFKKNGGKKNSYFAITLDPSGALSEQKIVDYSKSGAEKQLVENGFYVRTILDSSEFIKKAYKKRWSIDEKISFCYEMKQQLLNGQSINDSINLLFKQAYDPVYFKMLVDTKSKSLGESVEDLNHIFDNSFIQTIKAGEDSGKLGPVFEHLYKVLLIKKKIMSKVRGAITMPLITLLGAFGLAAVMSTKGTEVILQLYEQTGQDLPDFTVAMNNGIAFILNNADIIFLGILILLALIGYLRSYIKFFKTFFDEFLLDIPIVGKVIKLNEEINFVQTFSMLRGAGILVIDALNETTKTMKNNVYIAILEQVIREHKAGISSVSESLSRLPGFSADIITTFANSEKTGDGVTSFKILGEMKSEETLNKLGVVTETIKVSSMAVTGAAILALLGAYYLPIMNISASR